MKMRKTFIFAFLMTFLIGCVSVLLIKKMFAPERSEIIYPQSDVENIFSEKFPKPNIETEILEENNDWKNKSTFEIKLVETGEGFHGDQIEAKSGETWIGLFKENNNYFLRSTKIKVNRVEDVVVDEPGEKTGKSVKVKGKNQPLFLLKNAKMLRDGSIVGLYDGNYYEDDGIDEQTGESPEFKDGFAREFQVDDEIYTLRVKTGENKNHERIVALVLESDGKSQTLHSLKYFEDGNHLGSLKWAGDLDHDGKPDFYLDLYFHDNVVYKNLFLSSKAKKGKLVRKVATFTITGC